MRVKSDVSAELYVPLFLEVGCKVALLTITPTGYEKSIMDATMSVRHLLRESGVHDYSTQAQGPNGKVYVPAYFVQKSSLIETTASLYRPITKDGDPRIWFRNLGSYCRPYNLLAIIVYQHSLYVINLSKKELTLSLLNKGYVYDLVQQAGSESEAAARELFGKILRIHRLGYLPSVTPGDPGVGDTLEHALGISRNNSKLPDYKGIELKASRLTRNGRKKPTTRSNLFAQVPDNGLSYGQIVREYGRWTHNAMKDEDRLALENTTCASRPNSFGLFLAVNDKRERIELRHVDDDFKEQFVSSWQLLQLKKRLDEKHRETFWVKASSINGDDGREYFRYDQIVHTKNPNNSMLAPLIEDDKITLDFTGYYRKVIDANGIEGLQWRDHGMLFKIKPRDLQLLFAQPMTYDLETDTEL